MSGRLRRLLGGTFQRRRVRTGSDDHEAVIVDVELTVTQTDVDPQLPAAELLDAIRLLEADEDAGTSG